MREWPRITLVTPSFNQGRFIEETLSSVLSQDYPNLEYIVIDGGSSDQSLEILKRYDGSLSKWISEPDRGQSDALIKGFNLATGSLLGWLNSDDVLMPDALRQVGEAYLRNPGHIIAGNVEIFGPRSGTRRVLRQRNLTSAAMIQIWNRSAVYSQPGVFFPADVYREVGGLDRSLHYCMDHDLMIRLLARCSVAYLGLTIAAARQHAASKTCSQSGFMVVEANRVCQRYLHRLQGKSRRSASWALHAYLLRCAAGRVFHGAPSAVWPILKEFLSPAVF